MNIALWIIAALLALFFLAAGLMKIAQSKEKLLTNPSMTWAEDFSPGVINMIGLAEILAAIGLILPRAVDVAPVLVPLAASGLALIMVGAAVTHGRRGERDGIVKNVVLLILTLIVAWGRFGPYSH
ncbi:DoxX family protein [Micromonospora sp. NPDC049559]|uniref:DoxX family protein n=1 Tax=Micromonospora sp. NPDC049559 TaxID=3155923 RepID=UPI0034461779